MLSVYYTLDVVPLKKMKNTISALRDYNLVEVEEYKEKRVRTKNTSPPKKGFKGEVTSAKS